MTKSDLTILVANKAKINRAKAEVVVDTVFESIVEALKRNDHVVIRDLGTFGVRHRVAYRGHNPHTDVAVDVPAKRFPFFKPGKEMKQKVNR
jgi:integration host factor subunit beta